MHPGGRPPLRSLGDRAADDLRYIRTTLETSIETAGRFTAVPGKGAVAMGVIALIAAGIGSQTTSIGTWLSVWTIAAVLAVVVGLAALHRKAQRLGVRPLSGAGRRFLLCLCPAIVVGATITWPLVKWGQVRMLPAVWLLHYGAGVVAAGAQSVAVVPLTGAGLMALGGAALFFPGAGNTLLAIGFGLGHVIAGIYVARRHGG